MAESNSFAITVAIFVGSKTSRKISKPIELVADYSRKLAMDYDSLEFSEADKLNLSKENEAGLMIKALEQLVKGIHDNVNVVKRVAGGSNGVC